MSFHLNSYLMVLTSTASLSDLTLFLHSGPQMRLNSQLLMLLPMVKILKMISAPLLNSKMLTKFEQK
jgi:hypothetical protein